MAATDEAETPEERAAKNARINAWLRDQSSIPKMTSAPKIPELNRAMNDFIRGTPPADD